MCPDDGLDQFLPVAATAEQEHEAEGPDEVTGEEHQPIGRQSRTVGVDYLRGLSPQEVTQPAVDGDRGLGEVAPSDVRDRSIW